MESRNSRLARHTLVALLLALAPLSACVGDDDDDSAMGDDDDSAAGDDDDSADTASPITAVTFAATLQGAAGDWSGDDGAVTDLEGTFHLIYWESLADQALYCRQRVAFEAQVRFGEALSADCNDCAGRLLVTSAFLLPPEDFEDGCSHLPPELDLAFLLATDDVTLPADFRLMELVPAIDLLASGAQLGKDGLMAEDIMERYATADLEVLHVAYVSAAGWLAGTAALEDVATPRAGGSMPMFVVYADGGTVGSPTMEGDSFMATLWTVRVGAGLTTDSF